MPSTRSWEVSPTGGRIYDRGCTTAAFYGGTALRMLHGLDRFSAKYLNVPIPFSVRTYDDSSLFAGKLSAVLARAWRNRVKGRDWYDFGFFVARRIPVSLVHIEAHLRQGDYLQSAGALSLPLLKELLHERIERLDVGGARRDVEPFVTDPRNLEVWSRDFFRQMTDQLVASAS